MNTRIFYIIRMSSGLRDTSASCVTLGKPLAFSLLFLSRSRIQGWYYVTSYRVTWNSVISSHSRSALEWLGPDFFEEVGFELLIEGPKDCLPHCNPCHPPTYPLQPPSERKNSLV